MTDKPLPANVQTRATEIGDTPLDWGERADGTLWIVFCNKGKHIYPPSSGVVSDHPAPAAPARAEEQEAEQRTPAPDPVIEIKIKPKRSKSK